MKQYVTEIKAVNPKTGKLTNYMGPYVLGISFEDAERYCQLNGLGYCDVTGELISEIDEVTGERNDFDKIELN